MVQVLFVQNINRMFVLFKLEGYPSGQREQTVNLSAKPSEVRILPPPQKCVSERR